MVARRNALYLKVAELFLQGEPTGALSWSPTLREERFELDLLTTDVEEILRRGLALREKRRRK